MKIFLFFSTDPSSWLSRLIIRITGRQLPDRTDAWSHLGLGFVLDDGTQLYYEALFSQGFTGPKPFEYLRDFARAGGKVWTQPLPNLSPEDVKIIKSDCDALVGRAGYYAWQLIAMWLFERLGRFLRIHIRPSPSRVVCSEVVARLVYPWLDLRDTTRTRFDEVNPNSAWRKLHPPPGNANLPIGRPHCSPLPVIGSLLLLLLTSCASYRIQTPCGDAVLRTFCKNVAIPKITIVTSNAVITIEGYSGTPSAETITASTGALGNIIGSATKAAIK